MRGHFNCRLTFHDFKGRTSEKLLLMWVVVKIMVPFWVPNIVRHLIFRVPKRDHNFDNHPCSDDVEGSFGW